MDDSHKEEVRREASKQHSDVSRQQPLNTDSNVEETREEQNQERLDENMVEDQEQNETETRAAAENELEIEEDETEGLPKSLRRSFKAVKRFFKGSGKQGRGDDPVSTFQSETPQPQVSQELANADTDVYDFTHKNRGRAIIINNEKFERFSSFDSRPGSKCDQKALVEMFKHLEFDVIYYNDLNAMEMKYALEKEARQYDHHTADCLAVAILSHGDSKVFEKAWSHHQRKAHKHDDRVRRDLIFGVDGTHISTASIIRTFQDDRCPGLQGKPRLFFLQACRGEHYDDGVEVKVIREGAATGDNDDQDYVDEIEETDTGGPHHKRYVVSPAPIFKDFLVMYATTPGHFAWRRSSGTWFIQSLHSVFVKQLTQHMSLTQALTRVSRMVAQGYQSQGTKPSMSGKKQMPVMESMLTKDVYFAKK